MAHSGLSSRNGILASPTTTRRGLHKPPRHDTPEILMLSPDAADHAGGQILLNAVDGTRRRGSHKPRLELLAVGPVVDPITRGSDPLAGGDRGRVADDSDEIPMSARLYTQHAEAAFGIMERHSLNGAGEHLAVGPGGGRRRGHRLDNGCARRVWRAPRADQTPGAHRCKHQLAARIGSIRISGVTRGS